MKLYSGVLSPFSAKVRIALAEKQLAYEIVEVPWSRSGGWGPKPPELLAHNPRGQVPLLVDGEAVLYDSTVIVEYLEDAHPHPALYPSDSLERARCRQWEDAADELLAGPVTALVQEVFNKPDGAGRDEARTAAAREALQAAYGRLDKALAGGAFLGPRFGAADIATFLAVGFATVLGTPPGEAQANLRGWVERTQARESIGQEFAAMTREAARA